MDKKELQANDAAKDLLEKLKNNEEISLDDGNNFIKDTKIDEF